MSLCRFLPIPSDRMGILWSLLTIDDSVILEYGPAGTTHYSVGFFGKMNLGKENRLFTTHMSEDDVIMGNTERLEDAIREVDEVFSPKVMFIVASSVSSVIGTDIRGISNQMQPEVKAKLIALDEGGFKGDYSAGQREITKQIVKALVEEPKDNQDNKNNKKFNIIGASMGSYRIESDINELSKLMFEAFDYSLHASLFTETSIEQIQTMSEAQVNLVIGESGLETAEYLKEKFNIPYVYACPYGYKGTLNWLEQIASVLSAEINPLVLNELNEKIAESSHYPMFLRMMRSSQPKAYIYGDYDNAKGIAKFLEDMACEVQVECKHSLKGLDSDNISYMPVEKDRINTMKDLSKTFLLADDISISLADETNTKIRFTLPFLKGAVISTHMPFMGISGANFIREQYEEYIGTLS